MKFRSAKNTKGFENDFLFLTIEIDQILFTTEYQIFFMIF